MLEQITTICSQTNSRCNNIQKNLSSDKVLFFDKVARAYWAAKKAKWCEKSHLINYFFVKFYEVQKYDVAKFFIRSFIIKK